MIMLMCSQDQGAGRQVGFVEGIDAELEVNGWLAGALVGCWWGRR